MRASAVAEAVMDLPWLCPGADALLTLAGSDKTLVWPLVRSDPGIVLLAVRHSSTFSVAALRDPDFLDASRLLLTEQGGRAFVDWTRDEVRPVYRAACRCAALAQRIGEATGECSPEGAWAAGLLAPLGWLAVCALDPLSAQRCLLDTEHSRSPAEVENAQWGFDACTLGRRLARRWRLPDWLTSVVGCLGLPAEMSVRFGASLPLFPVVQAALLLTQRGSEGLALPVGVTLGEAAAGLGLTTTALEDLARAVPEELETTCFRKPTDLPLLAEVLRLSAENRRLRGGAGLWRLEEEIDTLHQALHEARAGEAERLRALKLNALAEFAAGAGHEINNPLAVISGQAQFLLAKMRGVRSRLVESETNGHAEPPPIVPPEGAEAETSLRKIVDQAQRIHQILRELMQFARPPRPRQEDVDLGDLLREVAASLDALAVQRKVRLVCRAPDPAVPLHADPAQLRQALTCLLRNAVEAAPENGWASVRVEAAAAELVEVIVEDSGSGPPAQQREHLFDPFYSGRAAGRGRGLGLPTAWRLAREHGGDVRFVSLPEGPTRFVLSLSRVLPHRNGARS